MSDLDYKIRDFCKARLKEAHAEMMTARAEVQRLWAEREKVDGPVKKKKSGRPSIWKGSVGCALVHAVEEIIIRKLSEGGNEEEEGPVDLRDPEYYGLLQLADRVHARSPKGSSRLYNLGTSYQEGSENGSAIAATQRGFSAPLRSRTTGSISASCRLLVGKPERAAGSKVGGCNGSAEGCNRGG
jgi:hypothetical protein